MTVITRIVRGYSEIKSIREGIPYTKLTVIGLALASPVRELGRLQFKAYIENNGQVVMPQIVASNRRLNKQRFASLFYLLSCASFLSQNK